MSEYIVRMEMPENCLKCPLRNQCEIFCNWFWHVVGRSARKPYPKPFDKGCRIVCQLPEGHGDLIDRDALKENRWDADTRCGYVQVVDVGEIDNAPTIVPTERREM